VARAAADLRDVVRRVYGWARRDLVPLGHRAIVHVSKRSR